jgi:hypothetical protein
MVDGRDQFREDGVTILSNAQRHDITNAWTASPLYKEGNNPRYETFPKDDEAYKAHDKNGQEIKVNQNGMDIFLSMRRVPPEVTARVMHTRRAPDG